MDSLNGRFLIAAVIAAVSMATIGVFSRYSQLPAEMITFFRLFIGAIFLLVVILLQKKSVKLHRAAMVRAGFMGAFLAGFILFYIQSMNWTLMANAIFFVYLGPVVATLLARVIRKERLNRIQWMLMGCALFGFILMQQGLSFSDLNLGILFALIAMGFYGGFIFTNGGMDKSVDASVSAFWQLSLGAVIVLPIVLVNQNSWVLTGEQWMLMLMVGFLPGFIALYCAILALKHLPAGVYGTITYLEPVTVTLFGWLLYAETLTLMQSLGAFVILTAGILQALYRPDVPQPSAVSG